jgi:hypothetical protein
MKSTIALNKADEHDPEKAVPDRAPAGSYPY